MQRKGKASRRLGRGSSPEHPYVASVKGAYRKAGVTKLLRELNDDSILTARLTYSGQSIATDATGALLLGSVYAASNVRSTAAEFTSYNLRYDLYRVIAIRLHFFPKYFSAITGSLPPSQIDVSCSYEGQAATTAAEVYSSAYCRSFSGFRPFIFDAIPANNTDCWLWTGTNSSVATANDFQINWCSHFQAVGTASTTFGNYAVEIVCQFSRRGG